MGYTVSVAEPAPDLTRDGVIWYGQRSFGTGEPRLVVEKPGFPWLPVLAGGILILLVMAGSYWIMAKRRSPPHADADDSPVALSETELFSLEERIVQLAENQWRGTIPVRDRQKPGIAQINGQRHAQRSP